MKIWTITLLSVWSMLLFVGQDVTGRLDGNMFPVVEDFKIHHVEQAHNGIEIYGSFYKTRNCDYITLEAYMTKDGVSSFVEIDFRDSETVRPPGDHHYGPWYIKIGVEDLQDLDIYSHHNCYGAFDTITQIY